MVVEVFSEHYAGLCRGNECRVVCERAYHIRGKDYKVSLWRCSAFAAKLFAQQGEASLANDVMADACGLTIVRSTKIDQYIELQPIRQRTLAEALEIVEPCTDHGPLSTYYVLEDIQAAMGDVWTCPCCGSTGQTVYDKRGEASWSAHVYDDVSNRWIGGDVVTVPCCTAPGCKDLAIEVAKKECEKDNKEILKWVREKRQWREARQALKSVRTHLHNRK